MAHINLPPDLDKHKSKMENELLIKLGVKKEEVRLCNNDVQKFYRLNIKKYDI
jgi:hypothetical protein